MLIIEKYMDFIDINIYYLSAVSIFDCDILQLDFPYIGYNIKAINSIKRKMLNWKIVKEGNKLVINFPIKKITVGHLEKKLLCMRLLDFITMLFCCLIEEGACSDTVFVSISLHRDAYECLQTIIKEYNFRGITTTSKIINDININDAILDVEISYTYNTL